MVHSDLTETSNLIVEVEKEATQSVFYFLKESKQPQNSHLLIELWRRGGKRQSKK
jgi:hypothetical protein